MLESKIRAKYQKYFIEPILAAIPGAVRPLHITVLSLVSGLLIIPMIVVNELAAVGLMFLSGYLDSLDGSLARFRNDTSDVGAVLDIMSDRAVECAVFIALFFKYPDIESGMIILMLIATLLCITSFLVVGIFEKNTSGKQFHYSPGLIERAEAFIFFALMILFPGIFVWLAIVYTVLVLYTAIVRVNEFCKARGVYF